MVSPELQERDTIDMSHILFFCSDSHCKPVPHEAYAGLYKGEDLRGSTENELHVCIFKKWGGGGGKQIAATTLFFQ